MSAGACFLTKKCNCCWKIAFLVSHIPAGALFSNKKWEWGGVNRELETYWPACFQWRLTPSHPPLVQTAQFYGPSAPSRGQIKHFWVHRPYGCELLGAFVCADEPKSAASVNEHWPMMQNLCEHICFAYISYPFVFIRTHSYWLSIVVGTAGDINSLSAKLEKSVNVIVLGW